MNKDEVVAEKDLFEKRVKFSRIEKDVNWSEEYEYFPNKWLTKYMGRIYPALMGYEIVSEALGRFLFRNRYHCLDLVSHDPELFNLSLKCLEGEFEK